MFKPPKVSELLIDENNYHPWVKEIERLLRLAGLANVVTGTATTRPSVTLAIAEWQDLTDKALVTILANCDKEPQQLIRDCDTAAEAWETLKKHCEGRTRTHLSSLLLNITTLRYDDRTITMSDHINIFEKKWSTLRQSVASATAGPDTLASAIKHFAHSDGWKATLLLGILPKIPLYHNIIDNITAGMDAPAYSVIVLRLKELSDRTIQRKTKKDEPEPPAAFATERPQRFRGYCKTKGWPGTSHNEVDCRTKKRDSQRASEQTHTITDTCCVG